MSERVCAVEAWIGAIELDDVEGIELAGTQLLQAGDAVNGREWHAVTVDGRVWD
jgi:hypothetical protein